MNLWRCDVRKVLRGDGRGARMPWIVVSIRVFGATVGGVTLSMSAFCIEKEMISDTREAEVQ